MERWVPRPVRHKWPHFLETTTGIAAMLYMQVCLLDVFPYSFALTSYQHYKLSASFTETTWLPTIGLPTICRRRDPGSNVTFFSFEEYGYPNPCFIGRPRTAQFCTEWMLFETGPGSSTWSLGIYTNISGITRHFYFGGTAIVQRAHYDSLLMALAELVSTRPLEGGVQWPALGPKMGSRSKAMVRGQIAEKCSQTLGLMVFVMY